MRITIEREFTTAEAGGIAVTAAEGGVTYWAILDEYRPSRWFNRITNEPTEVSEDFVFYNVAARDDNHDDVSAWVPVTPRLIRRGVQLYLESHLFDDMEDFAAMDSNEADCVIQLGAYGSIIYS